MPFDEMDKDKLKESAKAGAEARWGNDKTIEDIVKEEVNNQVLRSLVKGLIDSGKKGNVKAVEQLLKYLEVKKKEEVVDDFPM